MDGLLELAECAKHLNKAEKFSFDLETTGLDPRTDRIRGVGVASDERQWYFQVSGKDSIPLQKVKEGLSTVFGDREKLCIGHNLKFDLQFCKTHDMPISCKIGDTMILAYALDENRSNTGRLSLKGKGGLIDELFGVELSGWEESDLSGNLFGKPEAVYAKADVEWTMRCWNKLVPNLSHYPAIKKFYWDVSMKIIPIIAEMELSGMHVNTDYLLEYQGRLQKEAEVLENEFKQATGTGVSIGSPAALSRFLFDDESGLKLRPTPWMKKGKNGLYSTDEGTISRYAKDYPLCQMILDWRGKNKLLSTYVGPFMDRANKDEGKRIYGGISQTGTVTGRFSSANPNLQNLPRDKDSMRKAFSAPPGKKLLVADYSQLELRLMAHMSQDAAMLEIYRTGGDIHDNTLKALGLTERTVAKNCNFGLIYGLYPQGLKDQLWAKAKIDKSLEECGQWRAGFFIAYPGIPRYHNHVEAFLNTHSYVKTLTGRRRHLQELLKKDFKQALRMAINYTIQGSAADIMLIAMRNIKAVLDERRLHDVRWNDVLMLMQVHDELVFEVPEDLTEDVSKVVKDGMENAVKLSIPLEVDPGVSDNWEEAKG